MDLKTKMWSLGAHLSKSHFFGKEREEKGEKRLRLGKYQVLDGISSHFLLLRDQATYKGRFEEI